MRKLFSDFDWAIFIGTVLLIVLGLAIIRSVAPTYFTRQLVYSVLGILLFMVFSQIDYRVYPKLRVIFYSISLVGLLLTFVFGAITRGSIRWLQIAGFTFQPSELVKPFLIFSFASYFSAKEITSFKTILANLMLLVPPLLLIFIQPDLGSSLIIGLVWTSMLIASGTPIKLISKLFLLLVVVFPFGWFLLKGYQQARIFSFINPFSDPLGSGYSVIQAMVAVGSGRLFGRGLGWGTQSHLKFLPEHHTDFIFASLGEELGFLGSVILILIFAVILWRLLFHASQAKEKFGLLLAIGIFSLIFSQVFINIGMNLGLMPITGITLPLVSSGGSSLLAIMILLGIGENIARLEGRNRSSV